MHARETLIVCLLCFVYDGAYCAAIRADGRFVFIDWLTIENRNQAIDGSALIGVIIMRIRDDFRNERA